MIKTRRSAGFVLAASGNRNSMTRWIVLIGASGVFGSLMARRLVGDTRCVLVLAGRRREPLEALRRSLGDDSLPVATLDVASADFAAALAFNGDLQCLGGGWRRQP
jgi:NADP-dependent 3-hydroxy acid dehydrogenase YdfG